MRLCVQILGLLALAASICAPSVAHAQVCVPVLDAVQAEELDDAQPELPAAPADEDESPGGERESPEPEQDDSSKDGKERLRHDGGGRADLRARATLARWRRDFEGALRADRGHQGLPDKPPRA